MGEDLPGRLGCFGYFGFGSGFRIVETEGVEPDACGLCRDNRPCQEAHQNRVRELFPEPCVILDHFIEAFGPEGVRRYVEKFGVLPFLNVMSGNVSDGARVASRQKPFDRGAYTLNWPLDNLRPQ